MNRVAIMTSLLAAQREGRAILSARESTIKRNKRRNAPRPANMSYNADTGLSTLAGELRTRVVNSSKLNPNI